MRISTLFSGSRGNSSLVTDGRTNILIDCGAGYRNTAAALEKLGLSCKDVSAIFITHNHCDHINGIFNFVKYNPSVEVFVHRFAAKEFFDRTCREPLTFDRPMDYCGIAVDYCMCHHDSGWCNGYSFADSNGKICYITDTGVFDTDMLDFCADANTLVLESNHDVDMLKQGSYPPPLKSRILSSLGHLSNAQTAQVLKQLLPQGVSHVVLAHLSENNNTPELARQSAQRILEQTASSATLTVATQWEISGLI